MWVWLCLVGNFALVIILILWLRAAIARPLRQATALACRVRDADLRGAPAASLPPPAGDAGDLQRAMADMNTQLAARIAQLRSGTGQLALSAGQLAAGSRQLAVHSERHSAAMEETAATLSRLHSRLRRHEEQAGDALAAANGPLARLAGLDAPLADLIATSGRIADIVAVIDDVAFRTTVLALEAAVAAARGGEHGGFAVVATEIGALAQRSARAAREIKALLDHDGQQRAAVADQAGLAMREVAASVQRLSVLVGDIHDASAGHDGSIALSAALAAMDQASREQAKLADENACAVAHVRDQAGSLSRLVDSFLLAPPHAQPAPRIALVASNPGKLSTPARAARSCAGVVRVPQERRGGGLQ